MNGPRSSPPKSMPFAPGTVLAGKYRVDRLLGEGGMGWVVEATHLQLEQRVALKFMHAAYAATSEAVPRFLREARAAARIQSEHVARVTDFGTLDNGSPFLVMEYLEGRDLDSLLRSRGPLPIDVVVDYAMQACEGLAEAHAAGIVHRDLKPANLFLARRSDGSVRVKLLDFGISKFAVAGGDKDVAMTSTQALMGSPLYMAPEQMRASKNVDGRADIWSMGVIVYEMLAGSPPFDGETLPVVCARIMTEPSPELRTLRPEVPVALERVVTRCLEKDRDKRFADVAAFARALAACGTRDAEAAADRIGRVAGAGAVSLPAVFQGAGLADARSALATPGALNEVAAGDATGKSAAGVKGAAHTQAEFSHTGPSFAGRRGARRLAIIGSGFLFAIVAAVLAGGATRGQSSTHAAGPDSTDAALVAPMAASSAYAGPTSMAPLAPLPPLAPLVSSASPADPSALRKDSVPTTAERRPVPPVPSTPRIPPRPKIGNAKPAATAAFGGRD